jgi:hypothetical protein
MDSCCYFDYILLAFLGFKGRLLLGALGRDVLVDSHVTHESWGYKIVKVGMIGVI